LLLLLLLAAVFIPLFVSMGLLKVGKANTRSRRREAERPRNRRG
jgi:hypothetical protein